MANEEFSPEPTGKRAPWISTRELVEGGLMVALATVLSFLKIWDSPYGGSVTVLSMAPIILYSLRWGVKPGLVAGLAHALIQLIQGMSDVMYVPTAGGIAAAIILDYLLPFTLLGLGGIFRGVKFTKNDTANLILAAALGALLVTVLRFGCHLLSGVYIWYELDKVWYADEPDHLVFQVGSWAFSAIYNGTYMLPEIIATTVATPILAKALEKVNKK